MVLPEAQEHGQYRADTAEQTDEAPGRRKVAGHLGARERADALFKRARAEGRHEPLEAYLFDALMGLGTEEAAGAKPSRSSRDTKVLVRVDLEALFRGFPAEGEV